MKRNEFNIYSLIIIVCSVLFIIEMIVVIVHFSRREEKYVYFEGVNAVSTNLKYYVTVGSNNDNDLHYEKAKISKYNLKKEKTMEKLYNVGYNSAFFGVYLDGSDMIAVGSYEKDESDHKELIRRALIVKYDKDAKIVFEKDFQILNNSKFTNVIRVGDYYYVTGQSIYQNTKVGDKEGGALLVKYDKNGEFIWSKSFGNNKSSVFYDLLYINDSLYVVGSINPSYGNIIKFDLEGNVLFMNQFDTEDTLGFDSLTAYGDSLYVSGSLYQEGTSKGLVVQYNYNCEVMNANYYQADGMVRFHKIVTDDAGYVMAIGTISKPQNKDEIHSYTYDGVLVKYDEKLKYMDSVSYGDDRDDYFTDLIFVDDSYLVVGYSSYEDDSYMSKFIRYSKALKVLEVG